MSATPNHEARHARSGAGASARRTAGAAVGRASRRVLAGALLPVLAVATRPIESGADAAATEPVWHADECLA